MYFCTVVEFADHFARMIVVEKKAVCTGHRAAIYALAPGQDERHFLTAGGDGWITEWNVDEPETGKVIAAVEERIFSLCTLPDRNRIVAGNMTGGVHWIDRRNPARTRNIAHHDNKGVFDVQVFGDWVFTAGGDGMLTRWERETGSALESLKISSQGLRVLAISAKRSEIVVGGSGRSIYFLDLHTFASKKILSNAHLNSIFAAAISPDGRFLLTGGRDAILRFWDLNDDFTQINEQPAHWYTINNIVYSPDGTLFASASRDKTIKIWDARSFQLLKVVDAIKHGGHLNSVNRLLWMSNFLISGSDDRSAIIWSIRYA